MVATSEESVVEKTGEMLEIGCFGILIPVGLERTIYKAFSDSRWVGGEGGYVEEEVHWFLVSFRLDVLVIVDSDGNVEEVNLTTDLFEVPLEFAKIIYIFEEVFPCGAIVWVITINPDAEDVVDLAFKED